MSRRILLALSVVASAVGLVPAPAHATPGGAPCEAVLSTTPGSNVVGGFVYGGPVRDNGTLRCSLQVSPWHSAPDVAPAAWSGNSGGLVLLPPTPVSFVVPTGTPLYLCSEWDPNPVGRPNTYAHHSSWTGQNQAPHTYVDRVDWITDPNAARCDRLIYVGASVPGAKATVDQVACFYVPFVVTGRLLGGMVVVESDGDVYVNGNRVYDCSSSGPSPGTVSVYLTPASLNPAAVQ